VQCCLVLDCPWNDSLVKVDHSEEHYRSCLIVVGFLKFLIVSTFSANGSIPDVDTSYPKNLILSLLSMHFAGFIFIPCLSRRVNSCFKCSQCSSRFLTLSGYCQCMRSNVALQYLIYKSLEGLGCIPKSEWHVKKFK